jgi:thioesterase domain-containing protein
VFLSGDWIPVGLPARVRRLFPRARVVALGGATEATVWSNSFPVAAVDPSWVSIPYGRPIQNARYLVLDHRGAPCPIGVAGDLHIGGGVLATGYAGERALTAERFVPDPWGEPGGRLYRTGDRARFLADGNLQFLGRLDHQVKVRGFRIELGEIEAVIGAHPAVESCAVLAREDVPGDRRLVAYVIARAGREVRAQDLRAHAAAGLPEYMVPAAVVALPALPLTPSGKLDRRALPAPEAVRTEDGVAPPRHATERAVLDHFEEVLGRRPISIDDDFFALGGSSLLAVQLIARVRRMVGGGDVPLAALFQAPTAAGLAAYLHRRQRREPFRELVAIQPRGDRPPFFCVHGLGGEVLSFHRLARLLGDERPFFGLQAEELVEIGDRAPSLPEMSGRYLEQVRTVQPRGPYRLGGYSYGAVVAFEMAQQLRRAGEQVALLAVLDGFSPRISRRGAGRGDVLMIAGLAREMARTAGVAIDLGHAEIREMDRDQAIAKVLGLLKSQRLLPPEVDAGWVLRLLRGMRLREEALQRYEAEPYDGRITLFRTTEIEEETAKAWREHGIDVTDPTGGWPELSTRPVEIYRIPGHHIRLFQPPGVEVLARSLAHALAVADERAARGPAAATDGGA